MAKQQRNGALSRAKAVAETAAVEGAAQAVQSTTGIPAPVTRALGKLALRNKKKVIAYALIMQFWPVILAIVLIIGVVGVAIAGVATQGFVITPSPQAKAQIPSSYMSWAQRVGYQDQVPWTIIAAIAQQTTDFGQSNPYTTTNEQKSWPDTVPPIGSATSSTATPTAPPKGVGPLLLTPSAASKLADAQSAPQQITVIGRALRQAANEVATTSGKSAQQMYMAPLNKSGTFWRQVVGSLPIAQAGNCAPPGSTAGVAGVTLTAKVTTPTGAAAGTATASMAGDIEYVFACELQRHGISLAAGPHAKIPSSIADDLLISEALQVSWAYSQYGTNPSNCDPFPLPATSKVPACSIGASNERAMQVGNIEAAAKAVIAKASSTTPNGRATAVWGVLPGVVVPAPGAPAQPAAAAAPITTSTTTTSPSTPAPTLVTIPGTWPSAAVPSQACETQLIDDLQAKSSSDPTGLPEPGPFSPAYPGAPAPTAGEAAYANAWTTSVLAALRTTQNCEQPGIGPNAPPVIVSPATWQVIVSTAAGEVYGALEVAGGAQAATSDLTGLITYLSSVTHLPGPSFGKTTVVPRLANPPVAANTGITYAALPAQVGSSGFSSNVVTMAETYDKRTENLVSTVSGGSVAGIPPGWVQWAQAAGQAECPTYPLMPYLVLAIALHETGFWSPGTPGTTPLDMDPIPVTDGSYGVQHAEGPLQFLPATFRAYEVSVNGSTPTILNPEDALFAAANMLCQDSQDGATINAALTTYGFTTQTPFTASPCETTNHAQNVYDTPGWATSCATYFQMEAGLGLGTATLASVTIPAGAVGAMLSAALSQVGHQYVWGAEDSPPSGTFDCSGLVDWSLLQGGGFGLSGLGGPGSHGIPTQTEFQALKGQIVTQAQMKPGDIIFYYNLDGTGTIDHVGIYIGNGLMVDAASPTSGILVQPYNYPGFFAATLP